MYNEEKYYEILKNTAESLKDVLSIDSERIRRIEKMLLERKCNFEFSYPIPASNDSISWRIFPRQSSMRLCYINPDCDIKPLIECKLDIRLKVAPFLVPFMKEFTEALKKFKTEIEESECLKK